MKPTPMTPEQKDAEQTVQEPIRWACKYNLGTRIEIFHTKAQAEKYVEGSKRNGADVSLMPLYAAPQSAEPVNQQLLEALKRYVMQDETHDMTNNNLYKSAIDAIAAAQGDSHE